MAISNFESKDEAYREDMALRLGSERYLVFVKRDVLSFVGDEASEEEDDGENGRREWWVVERREDTDCGI